MVRFLIHAAEERVLFTDLPHDADFGRGGRRFAVAETVAVAESFSLSLVARGRVVIVPPHHRVGVARWFLSGTLARLVCVAIAINCEVVLAALAIAALFVPVPPAERVVFVSPLPVPRASRTAREEIVIHRRPNVGVLPPPNHTRGWAGSKEIGVVYVFPPERSRGRAAPAGEVRELRRRFFPRRRVEVPFWFRFYPQRLEARQAAHAFAGVRGYFPRGHRRNRGDAADQRTKRRRA
mmetsp:Transcript_7788/g.29152  ORF Transcript_7788/g.29152 Transcript_7788/m.29152 type:complete len:237 (-) Transcript_7788:1294-2004(-)